MGVVEDVVARIGAGVPAITLRPATNPAPATTPTATTAAISSRTARVVAIEDVPPTRDRWFGRAARASARFSAGVTPLRRNRFSALFRSVVETYTHPPHVSDLAGVSRNRCQASTEVGVKH